MFDGSDEDEDVEGSRLPLLIVLALLVLAMFGGVVWLAYNEGVTRGRTETPVVTAANGPARVAPANPGGTEQPFKGFKIYEQPAPPDDDTAASQAPTGRTNVRRKCAGSQTGSRAAPPEKIGRRPPPSPPLRRPRRQPRHRRRPPTPPRRPLPLTGAARAKVCGHGSSGRQASACAPTGSQARSRQASAGDDRRSRHRAAPQSGGGAGNSARGQAGRRTGNTCRRDGIGGAANRSLQVSGRRRCGVEDLSRPSMPRCCRAIIPTCKPPIWATRAPGIACASPAFPTRMSLRRPVRPVESGWRRLLPGQVIRARTS